MIRGAILSTDNVYRYRLWRTWDSTLPRFAFVMLNPSTADAEADDPTIRKCIGFARRYKCGGVDVVNLFAYRATKPTDLMGAERRGVDITGPDNDSHISAVCSGRPVVCAWGTWGRVHYGRVQSAMRTLASCGATPFALALTGSGYPRHPLMLAYDAANAVPFRAV